MWKSADLGRMSGGIAHEAILFLGMDFLKATMAHLDFNRAVLVLGDLEVPLVAGPESDSTESVEPGWSSMFALEILGEELQQTLGLAQAEVPMICAGLWQKSYAPLYG